MISPDHIHFKKSCLCSSSLSSFLSHSFCARRRRKMQREGEQSISEIPSYQHQNQRQSAVSHEWTCHWGCCNSSRMPLYVDRAAAALCTRASFRPHDPSARPVEGVWRICVLCASGLLEESREVFTRLEARLVNTVALLQRRLHYTETMV